MRSRWGALKADRSGVTGPVAQPLMESALAPSIPLSKSRREMELIGDAYPRWLEMESTEEKPVVCRTDFFRKCLAAA
jgi:hypothetical protein